MLRRLPPQICDFGPGASFGFGRQEALFQESLVEVFVRGFCSFIIHICSEAEARFNALFESACVVRLKILSI